MRIASVALLFLAALGLRGQDDGSAGPDGDAWYYERIAVQPPPATRSSVPESWQDGWNPFVRGLRKEISDRLERERELPRLRFELQGDRSNKFALFRCLGSGGDYWIEWRSEEARPLDDLFLLPTRIPQADGTIRRLGFPESSRIDLSADGSYADVRSFPLVVEPGDEGFPIRVSLDGGPVASWRWVIEKPFSPFGIGYVAVSEIFALSGVRNVAPEGALAWSEDLLPDRSMAPSFLCDEKTPLGLPVLREETSVLGYHSEIKPIGESDEEWIELRWREPVPLSEIRLIPTQQRVLPHTETFGFPLAHRTEFFLRGKTVAEHRARHAIDPGQNVVTILNDSGDRIDRVRWTAAELWQRRDSRFLSLAEIEALGPDGVNLAGEAELEVSSRGVDNAIWNLDSLTDGLASEGRLISFGEWLRGLDEVARLRAERRGLESSLSGAIAATNRALLGGLISALIFAIFAMTVSRRRARRQFALESEEFRRRLADDLHDDLGGNLGSIVLLADQARAGDASGLDRVVELARESRARLREIVRVGGDESGTSDAASFLERLGQVERDFLGDLEFGREVDDGVARAIDRLSDRQRHDLLHFLKEWFHNLRQHSSASHVSLRFLSEEGSLAVLLEDDGAPAATTGGELLSRSARQRIRALHAVVRSVGAPGKSSLRVEIPLPHP